MCSTKSAACSAPHEDRLSIGTNLTDDIVWCVGLGGL
jgi:hypothetical protein